MTEKQKTAVASFFSKLATVRGIAGQAHTITQDGSLVLIRLADPSWPVISIGKQGGYGMPDIKSYPENGRASCYEYPGNTAFDAVLFGDKHLSKQLGLASRTSKAGVSFEGVDPWNFQRPRFTRFEIDELVARRQQTVGESDAFEAGKRIASGDYSCGNLRVVVDWKTECRFLQREMSLLDENSEVMVATALRSAATADEPQGAIEALVRGSGKGLHGIGVPVASAILTTINPEKYTIIDFQVLKALGVGDKLKGRVDYYLAYLSKCRELASEFKVNLRAMDHALWQWGHDH
jgi:hypothetical protein